jgi:transcriptional regulator with XRE-family HTH domain
MKSKTKQQKVRRGVEGGYMTLSDAERELKPYLDLGDRILRLRMQRGHSNFYGFARAYGLSRRRLERLEGAIGNQDLSFIKQVANALDADVDVRIIDRRTGQPVEAFPSRRYGPPVDDRPLQFKGLDSHLFVRHDPASPPSPLADRMMQMLADALMEKPKQPEPEIDNPPAAVESDLPVHFCDGAAQPICGEDRVQNGHLVPGIGHGNVDKVTCSKCLRELALLGVEYCWVVKRIAKIANEGVINAPEIT